ncbi:MAG TPA: gephyrin-like molybdotransferase Glp [Alphaproteobacteria bacterium]|nr:gephyrin-like molybdotransferase Glp [Alphaproteobacteria bacterium]
MISVAQALERIGERLTPTPAETVALPLALGRVLAEPAIARRTQPPTAVSAMDGYAVRGADVAAVPATLRIVGEAPAGRAFAGTVGSGEAVRIFTGGTVPDGADCIVIQEDTERQGAAVTVLSPGEPGRHIRPAGLDFTAGAVGLEPGRVLSAADIALAAAMDLPWLAVRRRPRIALLATGDELVRPGEAAGGDRIVNANSSGIAALAVEAGAEVIDLGIARDEAAALEGLAAQARGCDLIVTSGGASVGDHDLVRAVLGEGALDLAFWRIAMRPGKPLLFGTLAGTPLLGLPGNPVSSLVCSLLFLQPAIRRLLGLPLRAAARTRADLGRDLQANDGREDYLRARLSFDDQGRPVATPFPRQDSSMLSLLAAADCLVVRAPNAPAAKAGDGVDIVPLRQPPR